MNQEWIDSKFEGLDRQQLRQAGEELGCNFGPNVAEKNMRLRLCEKLGEGIQEALPEQPAAEPIKLQRMQRPRLSPGDKWEGRRHDVVVHRSADTADQKAFVLTWDFAPLSFPYDTTVHMPEPYYVVLKTAKVGKIIQEPVLDKDNFRVGTHNREVYNPRYSFNYLGVTPGTEHLPGSILEYWQQEAKKKNFFRDLLQKNTGRNRLVQIRSDLYGSVGPGFYKDLTNEDIWQDIIRFLGFEDIFYEDVA